MADVQTEPSFKALVVDDDPTATRILARFLAKHKFACVVTLDTDEAQKVIAEKAFDLIITDLVMPKMSGFELIRLIKSTPSNKNAKIAVLSANLSEDKIQKLMTLGVIKNFEKPVDFLSFSAYIKEKFFDESTFFFDSKFISILTSVLEEVSEEFFDIPQTVSAPYLFKDVPVDNSVGLTLTLKSGSGSGEISLYFEDLFMKHLSRKVNFKDIHLDSQAQHDLVKEVSSKLISRLKAYLDKMNIPIAASNLKYFQVKDRSLVTKDRFVILDTSLRESKAKFITCFSIDAEFNKVLKGVHDLDIIHRIERSGFF